MSASREMQNLDVIKFSILEDALGCGAGGATSGATGALWFAASRNRAGHITYFGIAHRKRISYQAFRNPLYNSTLKYPRVDRFQANGGAPTMVRPRWCATMKVLSVV